MVRVTLYMKVKPGRERDFELAWQDIAEQARLIPGNLRQTLLRDPSEESAYVITTEWESREAFTRFEVSPEQDQLTAPLRALRDSARQVTYDVLADIETEPVEDATQASAAATREGKGRVVFIVRLKPGSEERFLQAYESIRYEVARGVPGHIVDQVCQSPVDPDQWLITSEWTTLEDFLAWERTQEHRDLARPMRECFEEARSLKYVVRQETSAVSDSEREGAAEPGG